MNRTQPVNQKPEYVLKRVNGTLRRDMKPAGIFIAESASYPHFHSQT
jgi:hypothetical protein